MASKCHLFGRRADVRQGQYWPVHQCIPKKKVSARQNSVVTPHLHTCVVPHATLTQTQTQELSATHTV